MIELRVNGKKFEVEAKPHDRLSTVLRDKLFLHGVRVSCTEGECGSCTILLGGQPVTSCMVLAMQAEGRDIVTIEGLGTPDDVHPIQEAYIEEQGFQCGFCTPGFIMATKAFLDENPNPTEEEAAMAVSGNICRCGAYPYIVRSVMKAAEKLRQRATSKAR